MTRRPAETFPPCDYITAELDSRGWGLTWLTFLTGLNRAYCKEILCGEQPITPDVAATLARVFGTSAEMWLNLQASWDAREEKTG